MVHTMALQQIFVSPKISQKSAVSYNLDLTSESVGSLKQRILIDAGITSLISLQLAVNSRLLTRDDATLEEEGVTCGDTIRISKKLLGGSPIVLKINTSFGCTCCGNSLMYTLCRRGRKYEIETDTIKEVKDIFERIAEVNPSWKRRNPSAKLFTKKGVLLEHHRKLILYDLQPNDVLQLQLCPHLWFYKDFRTTPKKSMKELVEEDAELKEIVSRKKAEQKAAHQQNADSISKDSAEKSEEIVEKIDEKEGTQEDAEENSEQET